MRLLRLWLADVDLMFSIENVAPRADGLVGLAHWARSLSRRPSSRASLAVENGLFAHEVEKTDRIEDVEALARALEEGLPTYASRNAGFWARHATRRVPWAALVRLAEAASLLLQHSQAEAEWRNVHDAVTCADENWIAPSRSSSRTGPAFLRNEYSRVNLSWLDKESGEEQMAECIEMGATRLIPEGPLQPGDVFSVGCDPSGHRVALFRIQVSALPGGGRFHLAGVLSKDIRESARMAFDFLRSNARRIGLTQDIDSYDFTIQVMSPTQGKDTPDLGVASYVSLLSALTQKAMAGGLVILGQMTIHGVLNRVEQLADRLRVAMDAGARQLAPCWRLGPVYCSGLRCPKIGPKPSPFRRNCFSCTLCVACATGGGRGSARSVGRKRISRPGNASATAGSFVRADGEGAGSTPRLSGGVFQAQCVMEASLSRQIFSLLQAWRLSADFSRKVDDFQSASGNLPTFSR